MSQVIQRLQAEWNQIKAQADAVQAEYNALLRRRKTFHVKLIIPSSSQPADLDKCQQDCQREIARWTNNLQSLNQELKITRLKLKKIRAQLIVKQTKLYELQAQQQWPKLCERVEGINQLAMQLEQELKTFWQIAHDFQQRPTSWLPEAPQLARFSDQITVPQVVHREDGLEIVNQGTTWSKEQL
ncbi:MAG: hypothetical protein ACFBSC_21750 [Microcoleaceae cyanobacterium]